jgi:hypothetical protein
MNVTVSRQVRLLRRVGKATPYRYSWDCEIHSAEDDLAVTIGAASGPHDDVDLDKAGQRLHDDLLHRLPPMLRTSARVEVGVIGTRTQVSGRLAGTRDRSYALVTCGDVVIALADQLSPLPVIPWRGTCSAAELDPDLPVVFGPSAVLALAAGALEMPDDPGQMTTPGTAIPHWMSVCPVARSPYPPHDAPPAIEDVPDEQRGDIIYWSARTEHWMRPMRTTRASRGQYQVRVTLPLVMVGPALWVETLTSLDTRGRYWQASLSAGPGRDRRWLTQPWPVEVHANELLEAVVGQLEPMLPALDRDPVDGESFGWAPALLTGRTADQLGLRRATR